jgi:hypothetical protein
MRKRSRLMMLSFALVLSLFLTQSERSYAKDKGFTPEEIMAAHLKSIGNPEVLAGIKSLAMSGKTSVQFIQGGTGTMAGQSMVVSSRSSLGIIMKYGGVEYPGEYFAFDGTDVTIGTISPGQRSPLGDFIFRYNGLMKEGLLGGVWSLGWPLLDIEKRKPSLKYNRVKVDGRELHEIDYNPKGGMNAIKVKLFFEPDTFRHVRTEYILRVRGEQALQAGKVVTRGATDSQTIMNGGESGGVTRSAGVLDQIDDSHYVLVEKFDNFREVKFKEAKGEEVGILTLPHSYSLEYSVEGQGSTFLAQWNIVADQWMLNGNINPSFFKAQ